MHQLGCILDQIFVFVLFVEKIGGIFDQILKKFKFFLDEILLEILSQQLEVFEGVFNNETVAEGDLFLFDFVILNLDVF